MCFLAARNNDIIECRYNFESNGEFSLPFLYGVVKYQRTRHDTTRHKQKIKKRKKINRYIIIIIIINYCRRKCTKFVSFSHNYGMVGWLSSKPNFSVDRFSHIHAWLMHNNEKTKIKVNQKCLYMECFKCTGLSAAICTKRNIIIFFPCIFKFMFASPHKIASTFVIS